MTEEQRYRYWLAVHALADSEESATMTSCQLHPAFAPLNKLNHGFADVFSEGDNFTVRNYRILNGKVL